MTSREGQESERRFAAWSVTPLGLKKREHISGHGNALLDEVPNAWRPRIQTRGSYFQFKVIPKMVSTFGWSDCYPRARLAASKISTCSNQKYHSCREINDKAVNAIARRTLPSRPCFAHVFALLHRLLVMQYHEGRHSHANLVNFPPSTSCRSSSAEPAFWPDPISRTRRAWLVCAILLRLETIASRDGRRRGGCRG